MAVLCEILGGFQFSSLAMAKTDLPNLTSLVADTPRIRLKLLLCNGPRTNQASTMTQSRRVYTDESRPFQDKKAVGKRLQRVRQDIGLNSQAVAAELLPIGLDTYRKWEQGRSERSLSDIKMLSDCWNCDETWLYCRLRGDEQMAEVVENIPY